MCMKLDDKALDNVSLCLKKYCINQKEIIRKFYNEIGYLEHEWDGDNFESLFDKVELLDKETEKVMNNIENIYTSYYSEKAEMIRNRPNFSVKNISNNNLVSLSSDTKKITNIDKISSKNNKEIVTKILAYLRKNNLRIEKSALEKISFYDPYGKSKNRLYKNIMSININSPDYESDLIKLTGQHLFLNMNYEKQQKLVKSLSVELENRSNINDITYIDTCKKIKLGIGIETKYLNLADEKIKNAFSFFDNAFVSTSLNDIGEIKKYKKYFPNSYKNFLEILNNLKDF